MIPARKGKDGMAKAWCERSECVSLPEMRDNEFVPPGSFSNSTDPLPGSGVTGGWLAALAVIAAASIVISPFVILGNPAGHDVRFHLSSWMEAERQWHEGILYPRWAAGANYGLGEPRFIFYPPMSWMLGAALGWLLPWKMVPGAFDWLALVIAGASMFRLAREYMSPRCATLAAVLYAANPYYLLVVHQRCAVAELLASAFFPLVILYGLRVGRQGWKPVVSLALVFAVVWLANVPAAVIVTYSLSLLLVVVAVVRKSLRTLVFGAAAMALGFLLDAFYIVPATFEQKWISVAFPLRVLPDQNFLFGGAPQYEWSLRFNLYISAVALAEIAVTACAVVLGRKRRHEWPELWWALAALSAAAVILMTRGSSIAWHYLPELWYVLLPWKWLFVLNVALAIFVVAATARFPARVAWWLLVSAVLLVSLGGIVQRSNFGAPIAELQSAISQGKGYEGRDEYAPPGFRPSLPALGMPEVAIANSSGGAGPSEVRVRIERWAAESRVFSIDAPRPVRLAQRLRNYPAWRAEVNGRVVQTQASRDSGQMIIQVPAGHSQVRVSFTRTTDRILGGVVSAAAAALVLALVLGQRWNVRAAGV